MVARYPHRLIRGFFLCLTGLCTAITAHAQTSRQAYIAKYAPLAVSEMKRTGIPASITLAQALLESDNGNSALARASNNHFGIKCKSGWTGGTVYYDDDEAGECFRKYSSVRDSYRDHSDFLCNQERYAGLFKYASTDYRHWAQGLKDAGYATSPTYAANLIRIIEENNLARYDRHQAGNRRIGAETDTETGTYRRNWLGQLRPGRITIEDAERNPECYTVIIERKIMKNNGVKYVLAKEDDSIRNIADDLGCSASRLRRCNEVSKQYVPQKGDIIYIRNKRNRMLQGNVMHVVSSGESIRSISQKYGIKTQALYRNNNMRMGDVIRVGQVLTIQP
ncbi:MAG: glucosaminidase domain-containing protein [Bacteroidales bacterium]|nr:glucosaminidase domain-containing protein [Bacteroidales bacterium]